MRNDELASVFSNLTTALAKLSDNQVKTNEMLQSLLDKDAQEAEDDRKTDDYVLAHSRIIPIQHNDDNPLTLKWNESSWTFNPGPNEVPEPFARQYRDYQRDIEFQVKNQKRLANQDILSAEINRTVRNEMGEV